MPVDFWPRSIGTRSVTFSLPNENMIFNLVHAGRHHNVTIECLCFITHLKTPYHCIEFILQILCLIRVLTLIGNVKFSSKINLKVFLTTTMTWCHTYFAIRLFTRIFCSPLLSHVTASLIVLFSYLCLQIVIKLNVFRIIWS